MIEVNPWVISISHNYDELSKGITDSSCFMAMYSIRLPLSIAHSHTKQTKNSLPAVLSPFKSTFYRMTLSIPAATALSPSILTGFLLDLLAILI